MMHSTSHSEGQDDNNPATGHVAADGEEPIPVQLGQQLRAAREACHRDLESCGHQLRLPVRVLRKLEAGDYSGIESGVYLRNYLKSYGACVGLEEEGLADAIKLVAPAERKPALVSTGGISRSHYWWQRSTTALTYAILTAVIVVPLVWLGIKGGLNRELTHVQPLNSSPVAQTAGSASTSTSGDHKPARSDSGPDTSSEPVDQKPLMASMAPFPALEGDASVSPDPVPDPGPAATVSDKHSLSIALTKPSWVEVTTSDGTRLQYSVLPAGTHKTWHSAKPLHVSIGDTTGASVRVDGKTVRLADYQHANVAHFEIALKDNHASVQAR